MQAKTMAQIDRNECARLDAIDPCAALRDAFELPTGKIYLDGNSLGALPKQTVEHIETVVREQWGRDLISSWNTHGWLDASTRVGDRIGQLIGAAAGQVIVTDSTTINLFRLLGAVVGARPERPVILLERDNFPADNYIAQGLARFVGDRVQLRYVDVDDPDALRAALGEEIAALECSHVDYRTGRVRDMARVQSWAREHDVWICWDLAHSAGALPVRLDDVGVELAVGCGYKYLNGGPGAPAFSYVRRDLQGRLEAPMSGWLGHVDPFAFEREFRPAASIRRFAGGTPPILSMSALEAGVELMANADLVALRSKAMRLTNLFVALVEDFAAAFDMQLGSPRTAELRGNQVTWRHPDGYAIVRALIDRGVVGDFRAPDGLRFGFAPAYVRYVDVHDAATALREVMETRAWDRPQYARRERVT